MQRPAGMEDIARPIRRRLFGVNVPPTERGVTVALGAALALLGARRRSVGGALLAALGAGLVARGVSGRCPIYRQFALNRGLELRRSIVIHRPIAEVYAACRDVVDMTRPMSLIAAVEPQDEKVSHWIAAIEGFELEWLAELVEDVENRRLRWQAIPGGDVDHELTIELEPATRDRGTLVTITHQLQATQPFRESVRRFAAAITSQRIEADLIRLRQRLEGDRVELEEPVEPQLQKPRPFEVAEAERAITPFEDPATRRS
jgi:uncharacterized membrane protein